MVKFKGIVLAILCVFTLYCGISHSGITGVVAKKMRALAEKG